MKPRDLILHDFRLKLFALLLAILLWETIHLATQREAEGRQDNLPTQSNQTPS